MPDMRKKAQIVRAIDLTPSVRGLSLRVEGGLGGFRAGQWLNLHVATAQGLEKRAYSIASAPSDEFVELAVTRVVDGRVSGALHSLCVGDEVEVDGPHGFFTRDLDDLLQPSLLVGTGTGLSPLRSMLRAHLPNATASCTLLFGCRSEADVLWGDELARMAQEYSHFRYEVTLSRGSANWPGRRGYVQEHLIELASALGTPHVFVCGLSPMVSEVRALSKGQLGLDRKQIHSERYD